VADTGVLPEIMELSYSIDSQEKLLRLQAWGEVTVDGLIGLLNRAQADPGYRPDMDSLGDYREARGEWDFSEIQRLRDYILRVEVPCEVRWAAVLKPGSLAAAGHVLIVISEAVGARIKMRMFDDPQQALRWIRREVD
jgi:hypothetical protein